MAITSITSGKVTIEFIRVLQQIAIGYFLAFFLLDRKAWVQGAAAGLILAAYTLSKLLRPWFGKSILVFSKPLLTALCDWPNAAHAVANAANAPWPWAVDKWGPLIHAAWVLAAQWGVLYWLYRRKIFFKL